MDSQRFLTASRVHVWTDDAESIWSEVSWPAIALGVIVALAVQLMLSLLGAGIGFAIVDAKDAAPGAVVSGKSAMGVALWWIATSVGAVVAGVLTASEVTPPGTERSGVIQGIAVWALATVVAMALAGLLGSGLATQTATLAGPSLTTPTMRAAADRAEGARSTDPEQVRATADAVAKNASRASFVLFVASALGLIAAGFAGTHNRARRVERFRKLQG